MTPDEFLGRVRGLLPALRARAQRTEQLRRLPDETFAEFQEAGLLRVMQPKRYGGYELDPGTFYQAVMEVAAACGSSGWVFGVLGAHNWHLALFAPQAQEDVWGPDSSIQMATSLAPTGKIERFPAVSGSAAGGRFQAAATSATGSCSAASRRRQRRAPRPSYGPSSCRVPITKSTTTGT